MSMDSNGKVILAKHNEVQQANVLKLDAEDVKDGESMSLVNKDLGSCEIYPQTLSHNPNGRYETGTGMRSSSLRLAALRLRCLCAALLCW